MKRIIAVCAVVALAGCASTPSVMEKPGAGATEYQADLATCDYDAMKHAGTGSAIEIGFRQNGLRAACMKSKGWQRKVG